MLTQPIREETVCSRELASPTTSNIKPGAERRSTDRCRHENNDIGNPDGRIPEHIPARCRDGETITEARNPDIRVPDSVKRDNGLRAQRAVKTRDAEEGDTGGGERKETVHEQTPTEEQTNTGQEDTATGQDGPKGLERRHGAKSDNVNENANFLRHPESGVINFFSILKNRNLEEMPENNR
ncbi:hypothetical protein NDU88_004119 [Pleurodeles waltl]|uniref:Uncharacterized protein n=1 Tax=Pleurodeles waltl TaxID=8319 RepID=A0AAV7W7H3_PLEWA|nr:hypothetical protein NDU88_004119 [Pleurodeles waltl]